MSSSSFSSSSLLYPSSYSSVSPPSFSQLSSPPWLHYHQHSAVRARDQLEALIGRPHRHPTPVLSSLSETYNSLACSPRSASPTALPEVESNESFLRSGSRSRPIPIPQRSNPSLDQALPVIPLTGRFDEGDYFHRLHRSPPGDQSCIHSKPKKHGQRAARSSQPEPSSTMRTDRATYFPSIIPASMSPSARPVSPQPTRTRPQSSSKSAPSFHLGTLPRFHPAVYQSPSNSSSIAAQPPSPRQLRQHTYRSAQNPRETIWQYRELVESVTLPRTPPGALSPSPSAPRLDPLRSPGPVTPLALEESGGYLVSGTMSASEYSSRDAPEAAPAPELVEKLIVREQERARQKGRKTSKGR